MSDEQGSLISRHLLRRGAFVLVASALCGGLTMCTDEPDLSECRADTDCVPTAPDPCRTYSCDHAANQGRAAACVSEPVPDCPGTGGGGSGAGAEPSGGGGSGGGGSGATGGEGGAGGSMAGCTELSASGCVEVQLGEWECTVSPNAGGAEPDLLAVILGASADVGTEPCTMPANVNDCGGPSTCALYVVDPSAPAQVLLCESGTIEITSTSPWQGSISNLRLREVQIDANGVPTPGTACGDIATGDLP